MAGVRFILVWLLGAGLLSATGWHRPFSLLGPDQGLPSGSVIALTQDSDGFLWFGTESGLVRYEGGHCTKWTTDNGLPSAFVSQLLPANGGGLWVSTLRGVVRFRGGRVEQPRFGSLPGKPPATRMAVDGQGRLWVVIDQQVYVEDTGLDFRLLPHPVGPSVSCLSYGWASGNMYVADAGRLRAFKPDGTLQTWGPEHGLPVEAPSLVIEDGLGRTWVGMSRVLVAKAKDADRFKDESRRLPGPITPNSLPSMEQNGSVWLPTLGGAVHITGEQTECLDAPAGLPFRWVRYVFRDREGTLWVLGPSLARLQGGGRIWNHTLSADNTGSVVWYVARKRTGRLLAGTDDGVMELTSDGTVQVPGTEGRRIKGLLEDRRGRIWLVTTTGPTLWLEPGQHRAVVAPLGDSGQSVHTVFEDQQGTIWLGHTRLGLLRWDPASRRLVQEVGPTFAGKGVLAVHKIQEDATGRLWAASSAGLLVRDPHRGWTLFGEKDGLRPFTLLGLAIHPDQGTWLHYMEPLGLTRVRVDGDRLTVLEHRSRGRGLHSDMVYAVQVDAHGHLWASTDQGLDRLDPPVHLGRNEGMVSEDGALQALLVEGDRVWVGTAGGLVRYDSGGLEAREVRFQAHILEASWGDRRIDPANRPQLEPIPSQEASLAFRVAVPSYVAGDRVRIQVRLNGLEEAWRDLEGGLVRYAAIPGGSYRFEARAQHPDGSLGPTSGWSFAVQPPWWGRWWARALMVLAAIGAILGIVRARTAAMLRGQLELEGLIAKRTEELKARNDELSTALGQVKQLSGLLPICATCKKIRDDKGYWNQLEHYISDHTDAGFSHGICPDCAETLYPARMTRRPENSRPPED